MSAPFRPDDEAALDQMIGNPYIYGENIFDEDILGLLDDPINLPAPQDATQQLALPAFEFTPMHAAVYNHDAILTHGQDAYLPQPANFLDSFGEIEPINAFAYRLNQPVQFPGPRIGYLDNNNNGNSPPFLEDYNEPDFYAYPDPNPIAFQPLSEAAATNNSSPPPPYSEANSRDNTVMPLNMDRIAPISPRPETRFRDVGDAVNAGVTPASSTSTQSSSTRTSMSQSPTPSTDNNNLDDGASEAGESEEEDVTPIFNNMDAVKNWRIQSQQTVGKTDDTIPDDAGKVVLVRRMIRNFKYTGTEARTRGCTDKIASQINEMKAHPEAIEAVCWDLLEKVIDRSEGGSLSEAYGPQKFRKAEMKFEARIEAVITTLRLNKNMCKHLYDVPFSCRVADDPDAEMRKVKRNRTGNVKKQKTLRAAKEAKKAKATVQAKDGEDDEEATEAEGSVEEEDEEPVAKRVRRQLYEI